MWPFKKKQPLTDPEVLSQISAKFTAVWQKFDDLMSHIIIFQSILEETYSIVYWATYDGRRQRQNIADSGYKLVGNIGHREVWIKPKDKSTKE
jgi:hypothetical protein